ncbi:PAS domain S-box protein [Paraflavisolibacter sp. H34]|uniref:sensor histidine kinase n=1 Tax=Huijunlia imazamoxiresistens TaxID=3127457 RepID=UPI003017976E
MRPLRYLRNHSLLFIFSAALVLIGAVSYSFVARITEMRAAAARVNRAHTARLTLAGILSGLREAETGHRGYLLTGDRAFYADYQLCTRRIDTQLYRLRLLWNDQPPLLRETDTLQTLIQWRLHLLKGVQERHRGNEALAREFRRDLLPGKRAMEAVDLQAQRLDERQTALLQRHVAASDQHTLATPIYALMLIFMAAGLIVLAVFILRRRLARSACFLLQTQAAGEEVRKTNFLFERAEELGCMGSWQWNLATNELSCSANLYALAGWEPDSTEPSFKRFLHQVHPDDRPLILEVKEQCLLEGRCSPFQYRLLRKDGSLRHMKAQGRLERNDKGQAVLLGATQDITEEFLLKQQLQQRTQLVESLVENSAAMIAVIDTNRRYTVWNRANERMFGRSKEEVIGKTITEVFPFLTSDLRIKFIEDGLQGVPTYAMELPYLDGQKTGDISYIPLHDADGSVMGLLIMIHDVTERMQTAEELREKNLELQQSNEELASFNYIASHDLQEPLRKIQTFGSFIETTETGLSVTGREHLKRIMLAAARMRNLIRDLLSFSRIGMVPEEMALVNLNEVLHSALFSLKAAIDEKEALVHADTLPLVRGVPFQLQQLFENLVGNAIKYSRPGIAPFISITTEVVQGPGADAQVAGRAFHHISFRDNGLGFDPQYAARIFELFQRLHTQAEIPGTGLGLAICKKIVHSHGGLIRASGKPGQGAVFEVFLPQALPVGPAPRKDPSVLKAERLR